jgi:hypothetical protein
MNTRLDDLPGQPRLIIFVRLSAILSHHVVDPPSVRLQLLATRKLGCQIHPSGSIAPGTHFVRYAVLGKLTHLLVETRVGPELVQMFGNLSRITDFHKISVLAVLDLKWDTTSTSSDDGFAFVNGLRDLDFEAFTRGELKDNLGARHQGVEDCCKTSEGARLSTDDESLTLIARGNTHDDDTGQ